MGDSLVEQVRNAMPPEDDLFEVAELFKAFGDATRAKIICALSQSELCVGDLALLLEMNQSAVSHQLRLLKQARLVKTRRDGRCVIIPWRMSIYRKCLKWRLTM